ncbi:MAG: helix-turn-helix domain-containing protein [Coriobacteriia bacterium]|nr:helix-turn-helix domain-containing protein [Coriobacteriia bacterium]
MLLNIPIIFDALAGDKLILGVPDGDYACTIKGVRFLPRDKSALDESYVYVVSGEEAIAAGIKGMNLNLVIVGNFPESIFNAERHHSIIFVKDDDIFSVLDKILGIFEYYKDWYQRLLTSVIDNLSLQQILDIGAEVLVNPIALLDASMSMIIKAGNLPEDTSGTIWEVLLSQGYSPIDIIPIKLRTVIDKKVLDNEPPFVIRIPEPWRDNSWMISGIYVQESLFGTFGSAEVYGSFTAGQLSLIAALKEVIEKALAKTAAQLSQPDGFAGFINQLLAGYPVDPKIIEYRLAQQGWGEDMRYLVYCIGRRDDSLDSERLGKYVLSLQSRTEAYALVSDNSIIVIEVISEGSSRSGNNSQPQIRAFLEEQKLLAGVSLPFTGFENLRHALTQARLALGQIFEETIIRFEDHYQGCLETLLRREVDLDSLVYPGILRLWSSNKERDRDMVRSLGSFLLYGRNLSATARQLHVHRNTLEYRLRRISIELGIELDELSNEQLLLLQVSCMLMQK